MKKVTIRDVNYNDLDYTKALDDDKCCAIVFKTRHSIFYLII